MDEPRISYEFDEQGDWPPDHPRYRRHDNRVRHVPNCQIPNDSLLRRLFLWPTLTDFVRQALGHEQLYTSACPYLALSLHIAHEGDTNGWHARSIRKQGVRGGTRIYHTETAAHRR